MRPTKGQRALTSAAALLILAGVMAACGDDDVEVMSPTTSTPPAVADFSDRGPYAVGVTELEVDSEHPVVVFYPVDRGDIAAATATQFEHTAEDTWGALAVVLSPAARKTNHVVVPDAWRDVPASADGGFPLLVLSHSLATTRFSYSLHAAHVASWGYVVAAPQHLSRDLVAQLTGQTNLIADVATITATIDLLATEALRVGGPLEGRLEAEDIAVEGHSMGGRDAILAAYGSDVDTSIALATAAPVPDDASGGHDIIFEAWDGFDPTAGEFDLVAWLEATAPPDKPTMLIVADNDLTLPVADRRAIYDWLPTPKRFAVLEDTGHMVFTDSCARLQRAGGLSVEFVESIGADPTSLEIQAVQDGCLPEDGPVDAVTAVWHHLVVAHLQSVFGSNPTPAAMSLHSDYLNEAFPERIEQFVAAT